MTADEYEQTDLPTAQGRSIFEIFAQARSYEVPGFQRGYSWTSDEVLKMLNDFEENFNERPEESYLLGQTILCSQRGNRRLSVIDGQQRLSTLYLFLVAAHSRLSKVQTYDEEFEVVLTLVKVAIRHVVNGSTEPRILIAENGRNLMSQLIQTGTAQGLKPLNPSEENLIDAYSEISDFLDENFGNAENLFRFVKYVCNQAYVLELRLTDISQAIRVFLVMNNRGMTLADADLIKNLLFQRITDDRKFQDISRSWNTSAETLFGCRLKRLRSIDFLLKALIGSITGETISSTRVFEAWEKRLPTVEEAWTFSQTLPMHATDLKNLSQMKSPSNQVLPELFGSHSFRWTQHFEVLLAGRHLVDGSFQELCRIVDARVMLSQFSGERNQDFERIVHKWAKKISTAPTAATREELLELSEDVLAPTDVTAHIRRLRERLTQLSYLTSSHRPKMRYVLARCEMNLERNYIKREHQNLEEMMENKSLKSGWHLDHVFPEGEIQNFPLTEIEKKIDVRNTINLLGNMILLSPKDNISQGKSLPSDKRKQENIAGSLVYLNPTLVNSKLWGPNLTSNSSIKNALLSLQGESPLLDAEWNLESIKSRGNLYFRLFAEDLLNDLGIKFADLILDV